MEDWGLSNFGDWFSFTAAANLVFVAADYFTSYSHILSDKVFRFGEVLNVKIDELRHTLPDRATIDNIEPVDINEGNTMELIEAAKDNRDSLDKELTEAVVRIKDEMKKLCELKTNSFISLLLTIYSVTALFLIGTSTFFSYNIIYTFWSICTACVFIVLLFAWITSCPEKYKIKTSSLKHCIYIYLTISIISALGIIPCVYWWNFCILPYEPIICISSSLLAISNFVVCIFIVRHKAKKVYAMLEIHTIDIEKKCGFCKKEVDRLISTQDISHKIKSSSKTSTKCQISRSPHTRSHKNLKT